MSNAIAIRKLLSEKNLSQRELAGLVGVTERTVRNWLRINGKYEASDRVVIEVELRLSCMSQTRN